MTKILTLEEFKEHLQKECGYVIDSYVCDDILFVGYSLELEVDGKTKRYAFQKVYDLDIEPEASKEYEERILSELSTSKPETLLKSVPEIEDCSKEFRLLVDLYADSINACATVDDMEQLQEILEEEEYDGTPSEFLKRVKKEIEERGLDDAIEIDMSQRDPLITIYPIIFEKYKEEKTNSQ